MARKKIALIGGGQIGGTLAHLAALKELGDIVLFDIVEGLPQGKCLDCAVRPDRRVRCAPEGHQRLRRPCSADVVIVTAGVPRKPGMSRDDLLGINLKVMSQVGEGIRRTVRVRSSSHPVHSMPWWALRQFAGLPHEKVGGSPALDGARFRHFLRRAERVGPGRRAFVLGGHGDTMVDAAPTVAGIPLRNWWRWVGQTRTGSIRSCSARATAAPRSWPSQDRLRRAGHRHDRDGAPYLLDKARAAGRRLCQRQVWHQGSHVGVPAVIGEKGVERIVELDLTAEEKAQLAKSADSVKGLIDACKKLDPRLA
jgi:malate dehydrogenase